MKRISMVAVAIAAAALILAGCKGIGVGEGDLKGSKWDAELQIDNSEAQTGVPLYKRYFDGIGNAKETVYEVKSTITIDTSKIKSTVYSDSSNNYASAQDATYSKSHDVYAVVGLMFDTHQKGTGKNATYDFALFGYQPGMNRFYIERYYDVKATDLATYDDSGKKQFGTTNLSIPGGTEDKFENIDADSGSGWVDCDSGFALTSGQTSKTITVTITQKTKGEYVIAFDGKSGKTYTYNAKNVDWGSKSVSGKSTTNSDGYYTGSIWAYGNVPLNTKLSANFVQDKNATQGLFAEVTE